MRSREMSRRQIHAHVGRARHARSREASRLLQAFVFSRAFGFLVPALCFAAAAVILLMGPRP